ncbi:GDSL-type esterase/lipase family protein [Morganella psychrotolerans]|uniref:DUF459 domain-containing protein n=1 Tax=Morganella psychrotolerans TaxID=368603 RepID=UPI0039B08744
MNYSSVRQHCLALLLCLLCSTQVKAKTLFVGDSLTPTVSKEYQKLSAQPVAAEYRVGSGLHSQKRFNWFTHIEKLDLAGYDDIVIVLGTNDQIEQRDINPYIRKIWEFVRIVHQKNPRARIVWISPVPLKDTVKNTKLENTTLALRYTLNYMRVPYIDLQRPERLGREYALDSSRLSLRTDDGIHLTTKGGRFVANILLSEYREINY